MFPAAKPRYVRINTLKITVDEAINNFYNEGYTLLPQSKNYEEFLAKLQELTEFTYIQDFHISELFAFAPGTQFHNYDGYISGAIVLQDKVKIKFINNKNKYLHTIFLTMKKIIFFFISFRRAVYQHIY